MSLPAKQNQYVEYAEKDSKGRNIAKAIDEAGGTEVVANPTLAGTESALSGLQVGETKYKVDSGTEVVANPTLEGTESALTGLQVGDTKYKVETGGQIYLHTIHIRMGSSDKIAIILNLLSNSSDTITAANLATFLYSKGYNSLNNNLAKIYSQVGIIPYSVSSNKLTYLTPVGLFSPNGTDVNLRVTMHDLTFNINDGAISIAGPSSSDQGWAISSYQVTDTVISL